MKRSMLFVFCLLIVKLILPPGPSHGMGTDLYGPENFTCRRWVRPDVYHRVFSISSPGKATMTVQNGGVKTHNRVAVAEIFLNNAKIFGVKDFFTRDRILKAGIQLKESNTLTVKLFSYPESFLTLTIIGEEHASIEILEPAEGVTVKGRKTAIHGTVSGMTAPWGVAVNGLPALVWKDLFSATDIPLREGENTLTAIATDQEGRTATASRTVQAWPEEEGITVTASPESGLSPLETILSIDTSVPATTSTLVHIGPGEAEILESDARHFRVWISETGIHHLTVETTAEDGRIFRETATVLVMEKPEFDAMIRETWDGMKSALLNGDISTAAGYFDESTQDLYREIFEALGDDLPRITGEMQDIAFVSTEDNVAKYRLRKDRLYGGKILTVTYDVYFVKDGSGLWKIHRY